MAAQLQEEPVSVLTIRSMLRDILETTDLTDPHDIVDELLKRIPKARYRAVLQILLGDFVRAHLGESRRRATLPPATSFPKIITTKHAGGIKSKATSATVAAIRDGWQRHLRDRINVGSNDWKMLKDCTYDDLMSAAAAREKQAEANKAWAQRFHGYAALLTEYDVKHFGDLPTEVHLKVLGVAA